MGNHIPIWDETGPKLCYQSKGQKKKKNEKKLIIKKPVNTVGLGIGYIYLSYVGVFIIFY